MQPRMIQRHREDDDVMFFFLFFFGFFLFFREVPVFFLSSSQVFLALLVVLFQDAARSAPCGTEFACQNGSHREAFEDSRSKSRPMFQNSGIDTNHATGPSFWPSSLEFWVWEGVAQLIVAGPRHPPARCCPVSWPSNGPT